LNLTLDTWIISDTHFLHKNIVKYCNRPVDHTEIMFDNWLEHIHLDDQVLHLGDIYMGPRIAGQELLAKLPGRKYYLKGNHDKQSEVFYADLGFKLVPAPLYWHTPEGKKVLFSHYPDNQRLDWTINIHGHIHNNGYAPDTPRDRDYRNISVEVMDYKPVRLRDILDGRYQSRIDAGDNQLQTRDESENKGGVLLPTPQQIGYFSD
jgi:calcineurin-like phosphoesterase family protein